MSKKPMSAEVRDRIRRMQWWHEAKFGMFIHWNASSLLGRQEWVLDDEGLPYEEYEPLAKKFKPKPNAARQWAKLARHAGMKYMVFTTKHHDGFCMFDTKTTNYCAPKQGPGRDLVSEYVDACRAEGLRVGFYYSPMDWHHPDGMLARKDPAAFRRYRAYVYEHLRELFTNYGKIDILWYDGCDAFTPAQWQVKKLNGMIRKRHPGILINNRMNVPEDFTTPEGSVGTSEAILAGRGWETCMTMNESWGYHKNDHAWKTPHKILRQLIACAHGGGNYLLNIGPKADGSVPAASARILTEVGDWMKKNGEAVYGAERCPVWGSCFSQFTTRGRNFYIHLYSWPGETWGTSDFRAKVKSATFLATGKKIAFDQNEVRLKFTGMPRKAPDDPITVIKLELAAPARIDRDREYARSLKPRGPVFVP